MEVMNWIGMDRIMFSSDYPHWDFDDPFVSLPPTPDRRAAPQDLLRQRAGAVPAGLMAKKHVVAAVAEIPPGGRKLVTADGRAIVVFNLDGEFFALSNRCPHRGGSLCDGNLTGLVHVRRARRIQLHPPRRDHPLPLARLGVRHPHRQILVRSRQGQGAALRRLGGEGRASWSKGLTWPRRSGSASRTTTWWSRPEAFSARNLTGLICACACKGGSLPHIASCEIRGVRMRRREVLGVISAAIALHGHSLRARKSRPR